LNGCWNKVLRVDLNKESLSEEELKDSISNSLIGGEGLNSYFIYKELKRETKPFDPENLVIFGTGPIQTTSFPGSAKFSVSTKSPLTESYGNSEAGGSWGLLFKRTGYDAIVIQGRSSRPVYLWVDDDGAKIKNAKNVWGADTFESLKIIREENVERASVAAIGPAGEHLVANACVAVDTRSFLGRYGVGAVMGSKKLKAIAVYGTKQVPVHDADKVASISKDMLKTAYELANAPEGLRRTGTQAGLMFYHDVGEMPIKYWTGDLWKEGGEKISGSIYDELLKPKPLPCLNCPIGCHRSVEVNEPEKYRFKGSGPEYETLGLMGGGCLVDDLKAIAKANDIANKLGADTIGIGSSIGFAIEAYERGMLTEKDADGLRLRWGDGDLLVEATRRICLREGHFGELFAGGTLKAAQFIGKNAEEIVVHGRGLDYPAHDPRSSWATSLVYATSPGADHEKGFAFEIESGALTWEELGYPATPEHFTEEGKPELAKKLLDVTVLFNSLVICNFVVFTGITLKHIAELLNAATGLKWSLEELLKVGERVINLQRMINIRDGKGPEYDKLPKRISSEPAKEGFRKGKLVPFKSMLKEYYKLRGWNELGIPTSEKLSELGIKEVSK